MRSNAILTYCSVLLFVIIAWWISRHINPALVTLIGLVIIMASTIWFILSIRSRPRDLEANAKSWWKVVWDGFWGL